MASPLHHRQASLAVILDFTIREVVFASDAARSHARALFAVVLQQFEAAEIKQLSVPFRRIEMVRQICQCSLNQQSSDAYLRFFFSTVGIDMASALATSIDTAARSDKIVQFTDYLIENFFLPLKACAVKTPQPTPAPLYIPTVPAEDVLPGSRARVSTLRRDCLIRDKHRCMVTRKFDKQEARRRHTEYGQSAVDDDGQVFNWTDGTAFQTLEVAHILPHSLMNLEGSPQITAARKNALDILSMFDMDVHRLITGTDIDRPTNALTLTRECHEEFGSFRMYFEAAGPSRTYRIASYDLPAFSAVPQPLTRTLFQSPTIDSPHPRLLAVHAAIATVLHMSAAGKYCDHILRDTEESALIESDGTTNLGTLVALRFNGWWDGVSA
ncbi:hypothetical protein F503_02344 [Ophiostoma piceae UAMH 11346]|uniref:HNH nuclease domain-containing protein n=1 Tax=Ophiostoma piceae (strain UAMH 11346) TaxID=1262450 RepID=S3CXM4_OPHP1|nr:hypothetical protein F503_02344 [Ophiostoma piceae UAMH 11346]